MKRIYEHRDELRADRTLTIEADAEHVRIACDSPGIASVSHVLSWGEWREMAAVVDGSWPEEVGA